MFLLEGVRPQSIFASVDLLFIRSILRDNGCLSQIKVHLLTYLNIYAILQDHEYVFVCFVMSCLFNLYQFRLYV